MIQEVRLDWENPEATVALDFPAQVMTIVNSSPFGVWARGGATSPPTAFGGLTYLIPAGHTMTVPIKVREWGFRLITSGSPPAGMAPAIIFFTQDETPPTMTASGVAEVTLRKTYASVVVPSTAAYGINSTGWLQLDDAAFGLEIEAPRGELLIGFAAQFEQVNAVALVLGIYDDLTAQTYQFFALRTASIEQGAVGVVKFAALKPGLRNIYPRAKLASSATSGWNIRSLGYPATTGFNRQYQFWAAGL